MEIDRLSAVAEGGKERPDNSGLVYSQQPMSSPLIIERFTVVRVGLCGRLGFLQSGIDHFAKLLICLFIHLLFCVGKERITAIETYLETASGVQLIKQIVGCQIV